MPLDTLTWDVVDHLTSDSAIAAYLDACLEDGDPELVGAALGDIAQAKGITDLPARTGLDEAVLKRELSGVDVPAFETIVKVVAALGLQLVARCDRGPIRSRRYQRLLRMRRSKQTPRARLYVRAIEM